MSTILGVISVAASTSSGLSPGRSISVCDRLSDALLALQRQRAEMLHQAVHQARAQRARRAQERGGEQAEHFIHGQDRRAPVARAAIAACRSSSLRARAATGASIMRPSSATAPSALRSAASSAATMRRRLVDFFRRRRKHLVQDRHLCRVDARRAHEAELARAAHHLAKAPLVAEVGHAADRSRAAARRAALAANTICCFGSSSVSARRLHAAVEREVLAADVQADDARAGLRDRRPVEATPPRSRP